MGPATANLKQEVEKEEEPLYDTALDFEEVCEFFFYILKKIVFLYWEKRLTYKY